MPKTTILAIATAILAVVTIAVDVVRADTVSISQVVSEPDRAHVRTTGALKVKIFDARHLKTTPAAVPFPLPHPHPTKGAAAPQLPTSLAAPYGAAFLF